MKTFCILKEERYANRSGEYLAFADAAFRANTTIGLIVLVMWRRTCIFKSRLKKRGLLPS
jgi:hypothetical protein